MFFALLSPFAVVDPITIEIPANSPPVAWAASELQRQVQEAKGQGVIVRRPDLNHLFAIRTKGDRTAITGPGERIDTPESYRLIPTPNGMRGVFSDDTGGMYALLDLAERVDEKGLKGLEIKVPDEHKSAIEFRGVNPFLSIPMADKDGNRDWDHWWFTDENYWKGYLDLLAKSRINWIDMHAMFDLQVTSFPNAWVYFVMSEKYPDVGVPPEQARKNLAMLEKVCMMAKDRGIRFALMNYTGGWNWPGARKVPERPVADFIEYSKEGLKQIVKGCPDLAMIGFRIGESGYGEDFYAKSYLAGLDELGRPLPLYTRTWGANKNKLMELGGMYPDKFIIEIKYNGEQMGPPWHLAGGRMAGWRDYSYQNYLFYPRAYKVIWQIRANGTNRVFQWANFAHIRECVKTTNLADSIGFCVEPMSTYYPLTDFLHKKPLYRWEYERSPLWYLMWGRLAYDPATPETVFRHAAKEHWGAKNGDKAYDLLQSMSRIVPTAKTQYSLGPDHRDHAPELEWGGSIAQWANGLPFDTFFAMGPAEYAREMLSGNVTGRRTPLQAAALLRGYDKATRQKEAALPGGSDALDDLKMDAKMLADLGDYYADRLEAATQYAMAEESGDQTAMESAKKLTKASEHAWKTLADLGDETHKPFLDRLRMHVEDYLWSNSTRNFAQDDKDFRTMLVSDYVTKPVTKPLSDSSQLRITIEPIVMELGACGIRAKVSGLKANERIRAVNLLWKPFRSEVGWSRIPMDPAGDGWAGSGKISPEGAMYGVEVITNQSATIARVDGVRPYGVIDPWKAK